MDVCLLVEDRLVFKDDPRAAAARARDRKGDKERRKRQVPRPPRDRSVTAS